MYSEGANSYRPISNSSFVCKFVERVVATRLTAHPERHKLFSSKQSAYRWHHNTETAVISAMNDIIRAIDLGEVTALVRLDLSAASDTMDHSTLLDTLHHRFAVEGIPFLWFISYLGMWLQSFSVDGVQSKLIVADCSVPQGSVLGSLEFICYAEDVVEIVIYATLSAITCLPIANSSTNLAGSLKFNQSKSIKSLFIKRSIFVKRLRGAGFGCRWASKAILNGRDLCCDRKLWIDEAVRTWRGSEFQIWSAVHEKRLSAITVLLRGSINK